MGSLKLEKDCSFWHKGKCIREGVTGEIIRDCFYENQITCPDYETICSCGEKIKRPIKYLEIFCDGDKVLGGVCSHNKSFGMSFKKYQKIFSGRRK